MERILETKEEIHRLTGTILNARDVFMIGRGLDYSILLELSNVTIHGLTDKEKGAVGK